VGFREYRQWLGHLQTFGEPARKREMTEVCFGPKADIAVNENTIAGAQRLGRAPRVFRGH
jgi:hypothetical protein